MRIKEIQRYLIQARQWRAWAVTPPENRKYNTETCIARAEEYEMRAARLLIDGARRWAARHPRSETGRLSYHRCHGKGCGSGRTLVDGKIVPSNPNAKGRPRIRR